MQDERVMLSADGITQHMRTCIIDVCPDGICIY